MAESTKEILSVNTDTHLLASPSPLDSKDAMESKKSLQHFMDIFSIVIMVLITFLDFVLFAIIFPSLLYYIESFDGNGSFYSWTLFIYSLSQAVSAPLLGSWASSRGFREVMFFSLGLAVLCSVLYSIAQNKWMIFIARAGLGVAAGSSAVTKAYFSAATTSENRTLVMTFATVAQALGFVAGPGIGGILSFIDLTVCTSPLRIVFDKYTMAGWFSAALGFVCLVLCVFCLREPSRAVKKKRIIRKQVVDLEQMAADEEFYMSCKNSIPMEKQRHKEVTISNSSVYPSPTIRSDADPTAESENGFLVSKDTSIQIISKEMYDSLCKTNPEAAQLYSKVTRKQIVKSPPSTVSLFPVFVLLYCWFSSTSSFTIFETLAAAITKKYYDWDVFENAVMWLSTAVGSIFIMAFFILYTNVGPKFLPRILAWNDRILCIVSFAVMTLGFLVMLHFDDYLNFGRWIVGAVIISSGIAVNQTLIVSLYSLVLDANNQGSWMGYQTTCGCVARIIAPLIAVYVFDKHGDGPIFLMAIFLLVVSIVLCLLSYIWMVPHKSHLSEKLMEEILEDDVMDEKFEATSLLKVAGEYADYGATE